jgi:hypothetical protein
MAGPNETVLATLVFAILHVGGTASDIGYVAAVQTVTQVAFILAGGVWADRVAESSVKVSERVGRHETRLDRSCCRNIGINAPQVRLPCGAPHPGLDSMPRSVS